MGLVVAIALVAWGQRTEAVKNANEADRQKRAAVKNANEATRQKQEAVKQENKAKSTSVQTDFDLAVMYQKQSQSVDPQALAHLARALRTSGDAKVPRQYLVSLLRDSPWFVSQTESLRHRRAVNTASFSPDGRRVVTASDDQTARVWDAESGEPVGEPMRHRGKVNVASFSPDGRRVVTASDDQTARVWDADSGKPVGEPMRHESWVHTASFSPDGRPTVFTDAASARVWGCWSCRYRGADQEHFVPTRRNRTLTPSRIRY